MKANALRALLAGGKTAYGTMIGDLRSPTVPQIMAQAGFDFVFFDMEHGPYDLETVADLVRVARLSGITPLVRVPDTGYHLMCRPLDLGAQGIMIPRIETRAQVEYIVESTHFPPAGKRGCSVSKGQNDFQGQNPFEFTAQANRENLIILQIEREQAVNQIEDLLGIPGVGAAIIGPNDLALSLGIGKDDMLGELEDHIQHVLDTALKLKVPCGIHIANLEWLAEWQRRGMQLITYSGGLGFLRQGAVSGIRYLKEKAANDSPDQ
jgi:2-dehydro-3-deoxyglucarate aldolase/4-hydroxy-2-oxoheptanedioate aldolase